MKERNELLAIKSVVQWVSQLQTIFVLANLNELSNLYWKFIAFRAALKFCLHSINHYGICVFIVQRGETRWFIVGQVKLATL